MRKIGLKTLLLAVILLLGLRWPADTGNAADLSVSVTLPAFSVSLNGHEVDISNREYPLLVYRDITYFPMTWHDSRLLGLESFWSAEDGLTVTQARVTGRYEPYSSTTQHPLKFTATVVEGQVHINGETINNSLEPYPLLSYRNVTYFPLTWRFAHDAFGWEYQWDTLKGLSITTDNPKVQDTELPAEAIDNGIALYRGNYYYVETTGTVNRIYTASQKTPGIGTEIYQYDAADVDGADTQVSFRLKNDQLWMMYKIGYGNYYVPVSEDGKAQEKYVQYRGNLDFRETPDGRLVVNTGVPDEVNGNLYLIGEDGTKRQLGDTQVTAFAQSAVKDGDTPTVVVGDAVYVLLKQDSPSPYALYRINLITNETNLLVEDVDWFTVGKGKLYYTQASDSVLYEAEADGSDSQPLSDQPVSWFDVIGDHVFYTSRNDAGKLVLYRAEKGEDVQLLEETVASVTAGNEQLLVVPDNDSSYGVILLDASGELDWRISERVSRTFLTDDGLLVQSARDGKVLLIR